MEIAKLKLRSAGMFSNVNEVIQQLYLAEQEGYQFVIDWSSSCYLEPERRDDPWSYYFEDCFSSLNTPVKPLRALLHGIPVACSKENIITPREEEGSIESLLIPKDRELPHRIIERYVILKRHLRKRISKLVSDHFSGHVIGLHIRGPGRRDGGSKALRSQYPCKKGVPFELFFKFVDKYLLGHDDAKIFACSDSSFVIQEILKRYQKRVFYYPATRSAFGEMHDAENRKNFGMIFPKYKLGEDVIIEAYLLSKTDYFIHGCSNITNFVLCKSPLLPNKYVYDT